MEETRLFRTEQPDRPLFTWADLIILLTVGALIYVGARLAVNAPAIIEGPDISLSPAALPVYALLGFATVADGDITLTALGETFAEASIRARKEIFATRIRRLPIFKWLLAMPRAADKQHLEWNVVAVALELEFPHGEAERQLDTIIHWGRYAELVSYEDGSEQLYLEPGQGDQSALFDRSNLQRRGFGSIRVVVPWLPGGQTTQCDRRPTTVTSVRLDGRPATVDLRNCHAKL